MANVNQSQPPMESSYGAIAGVSESTALRSLVASNIEEGGVAPTQVPDWQADGFINKRASTQIGKDVKRTRDSIFAATIATQAEDPATRKKIASMATSGYVQAIAFVLVAVFSGLTPFFKQSLFDKDEAGNKVANFIAPTPYIVDYIHSIVIGNIIALVLEGKKGLQSCWDFKSVLRFSPSLIMASAAEALQMFIFQYIDGTSWRILKQLKLPMTAIGVRFILGRKGMNQTQWLLILCVTFAVIGYCLHNAKSAASGNAMGITIGLASVCLTCTAAILGDHLYKTVEYPLHVQIPQGRIASIVCVFIMTLIVCWKEDKWHLFLFGGWSWRTWLLALWLTTKDWTGSFVLKHLDSVWKALAGVCALVVAYVLDTTFGDRKVESVSIAFMACVVINILAFAISKREQSQKKAT